MPRSRHNLSKRSLQASVSPISAGLNPRRARCGREMFLIVIVICN
jgi:hypothetical protein